MSTYVITVPCFAQMLRSLKGLLSKGEAHAGELGYDPRNLLSARLAPDMHTLATQSGLCAPRPRNRSSVSPINRCRF